MKINLSKPDSNTQNNPQSSIFHHPNFRDILAREFKLIPMQLECIKNEQIEYNIPVFLRKNWLDTKTLIIGAGFDKTGITLDNHQDFSYIISNISNRLHEYSIKQLELRTIYPIACQQDYSDKVELNIDLPLGTESVWNNLSTNTRKNIRRPLKKGFYYKTGNSQNLLNEFYSLYRMSLHELGSLAHPYSFFEELIQHCAENILIFVGYLDNKPVVSSISFINSQEIYGAWSGIHSDYKKDNVFLAMLWSIVEYCEQNQKQTYNLGRSSINTNPYLFKKKLANREHKIYYYKIPILSPQTSRSSIQNAASWLIRHTPPMVMDGLSRTLIHKFY